MKILLASEMKKDIVYMTAQSAKSFHVMYLGTKGDVVQLKAHYPLLGWKVVTVLKDYKVRELSQEEKVDAPQDRIKQPNKLHTIPGKVSGLGFQATWYKWIKEVGQDVHLGKQATIEKMLLEFPHREVTIVGRADFYRAKYNKGELVVGKKPEKVYWKLKKKSLNGNDKKRWVKKQTEKQEKPK